MTALRWLLVPLAGLIAGALAWMAMLLLQYLQFRLQLGGTAGPLIRGAIAAMSAGAFGAAAVAGAAWAAPAHRRRTAAIAATALVALVLLALVAAILAGKDQAYLLSALAQTLAASAAALLVARATR